MPLSRREYLTGFHKRKVERKKAAIEEMKQRLKHEQRKLREEVQSGRAGASLTLRGRAALDGLSGGPAGMRGGVSRPGKQLVRVETLGPGPGRLGWNLLVFHSLARDWAMPLPEVGLESHHTHCSFPLRFQRHQEYLKMLAEREEALGKSRPLPDWRMANTPGFVFPW